MIGAGNVAWHMSQAMVNSGFVPHCVFSRSLTKAQELANVLDCVAVSRLGAVPIDADVYIYAVKDDVLPAVINDIAPNACGALHLHTAGSVSLDVFKGRASRYGVIYPLQSFTKGRQLDFSRVPLFVEGSSLETVMEIKELASCLSSVEIRVLDSHSRKQMHVAAVFASNFVNHCYACAANLLKTSGVPFDALLPLIEETCDKVHDLSPVDAQTGPAVRNDRRVLESHETMLSGTLLEVYRLMSKSIYEEARLKRVSGKSAQSK